VLAEDFAGDQRLGLANPWMNPADQAGIRRRTDSAVIVLDQLPLAVQHPHLVLVVAGSSDGRGRNCLFNPGNVRR
jgi:hypothetical protein